MDRKPARTAIALASAALLAMVWYIAPSVAAEEAVVIPPPSADIAPGEGLKTFVLAGGCFWGVQGVYQHTKGVTNAVSGYAGGKASTANYEATTRGNTGHAEAVQITYDPKQVSLGKLLQIYFSVVHDPTQLNRQGPDHGSQYRSAIYADDAAQRDAARARRIARFGRGDRCGDRGPAAGIRRRTLGRSGSAGRDRPDVEQPLRTRAGALPPGSRRSAARDC